MLNRQYEKHILSVTVKERMNLLSRLALVNKTIKLLICVEGIKEHPAKIGNKELERMSAVNEYVVLFFWMLQCLVVVTILDISFALISFFHSKINIHFATYIHILLLKEAPPHQIAYPSSPLKTQISFTFPSCSHSLLHMCVMLARHCQHGHYLLCNCLLLLTFQRAVASLILDL